MGLRRNKSTDGGGAGRDGPAGPRADAAVELRGVGRRHGRGAFAVHALRTLGLALPRGSSTAVTGPSGSGRSAFLQCATGPGRPSTGSVRLGGTGTTGMNENELTTLRRSRLGFVFQSFNLLPALTVEQNTPLPMRPANAPAAGARPKSSDFCAARWTAPVRRS